jgi:hypothetical protein
MNSHQTKVLISYRGELGLIYNDSFIFVGQTNSALMPALPPDRICTILSYTLLRHLSIDMKDGRRQEPNTLLYPSVIFFMNGKVHCIVNRKGMQISYITIADDESHHTNVDVERPKFLYYQKGISEIQDDIEAICDSTDLWSTFRDVRSSIMPSVIIGANTISIYYGALLYMLDGRVDFANNYHVQKTINTGSPAFAEYFDNKLSASDLDKGSIIVNQKDKMVIFVTQNDKVNSCIKGFYFNAGNTQHVQKNVVQSFHYDLINNTLRKNETATILSRSLDALARSRGVNPLINYSNPAYSGSDLLTDIIRPQDLTKLSTEPPKLFSKIDVAELPDSVKEWLKSNASTTESKIIFGGDANADEKPKQKIPQGGKFAPMVNPNEGIILSDGTIYSCLSVTWYREGELDIGYVYTFVKRSNHTTEYVALLAHEIIGFLADPNTKLVNTKQS